MIVLVTGASRGIGAATARSLAAAGHAVVLGARRIDRLDALVEAIRAQGGRADATALDVTDLGSVQAFVALAEGLHGGVDVIVNNAGVMPLSVLEAGKVEEWNRMIDVNVRGATSNAPRPRRASRRPTRTRWSRSRRHSGRDALTPDSRPLRCSLSCSRASRAGRSPPPRCGPRRAPATPPAPLAAVRSAAEASARDATRAARRRSVREATMRLTTPLA